MPTLAFALIALLSCCLAAPLSSRNVLVVENARSEMGPGPLKAETCTSNGTVWEMTFSGQQVQQILIPEDCLFFDDQYGGFMTITRDRESVVLPCCIDQDITPETVGFIQIFNNGTTSAMQTAHIPMNLTSIHNIVLDGTDLWLVGRPPFLLGYLFYVNLATQDAVPLANNDTFFVNIVNNELLVANFEDMPNGLYRVGTGLPKQADAELVPVIDLANALDWFEQTDNYGYYAEYQPIAGLHRCDESWNVLYSSAPDNSTEITKFAVQYNNASDIVIFASALNGSSNFLLMLHDDGTTITELSRFNFVTESVLKVGSLAPINHCENSVKDVDETDVNCGGALCDACQNGKACSVNDDCKSGNCSNGVCAESTPVATGPSATTPSKTPSGKASDSSVKQLALGAAAALMLSFLL